jgi:hypothetical protein
MSGRAVALEGIIARIGYWIAQRQHLLALHGVYRTALMTLATLLSGRAKSRVKLH